MGLTEIGCESVVWLSLAQENRVQCLSRVDTLMIFWVPYKMGNFLTSLATVSFSRRTLFPLRPTQPPVQWVPGALSLGVKRPGRGTDHSPPSSAEVKNASSYTSTPLYVFMAWCLVNHRDFTFYLYLYLPTCGLKYNFIQTTTSQRCRIANSTQDLRLLVS
jgi:hypothetical protein